MPCCNLRSILFRPPSVFGFRTRCFSTHLVQSNPILMHPRPQILEERHGVKKKAAGKRKVDAKPAASSSAVLDEVK